VLWLAVTASFATEI